MKLREPGGRDMFLPLLLLMPVAAALAAPAAPATNDEGGTPLATVRLEQFSRYPAVELQVNGQGPFLFLLHTGVSGSAVSEVIAERLGLVAVGEGRLGAPGDPRGMDGPRVRAGTVLVGDLELRDVDLVRTDFSEFLGDNAPDGILGFDLLADYLWTVDFAEGVLRISRGALPAADGRQVLEYEVDASGAPTVPVRIGGQEMRARLDSMQLGLGLPGGLQGTLPLAAEPGRIGRTGDARGMFDLVGAQLADDVEVGGQVVPRPRVVFSEAYDSIGLGAQVLESFALTFDATTKRVRLERKESRRAQALSRDAAAVPVLGGEGTLRDSFNAQPDKVRLLLILSPT